MSFQIQIDATNLSSPSFSIPGISAALETKTVQTLNLEPSVYRLQTPAESTLDWSFTVNPSGLIDYATELDVAQGGFLSGRGSALLTVQGFAITIDARSLTAASFIVQGITNNWLANNQTHELHLLPATYGFVQPNGRMQPGDFTVTANGTVDYRAEGDAYLSGRGTSLFKLTGFAISIDARQLTAPSFRIVDITEALAGNEIHELHLLPAAYGFFQPNGQMPAGNFTVTANGTIDYPTEGNSYLSGRGKSVFTLTGYPISIDARQLSAASFSILGITETLPRNEIQKLNLLPATYGFIQPNGQMPAGNFTVTANGTVDYSVEGDAYLSGRGTPDFMLTGYPISIDARQLSAASFSVLGLTETLPSNEVHKLNLLPATYGFIQPHGRVPAGDFTVTGNGTVDYSVEGDAYLSGRGTPDFMLTGYPISIDARQLSAASFSVLGITESLPRNEVHKLNLLPAAYGFIQPHGRMPTGDFTVTTAGKIDYPAQTDGYLSGKNSSTFVLRGYGITIDATTYRGTPLILKPLSVAIDTENPELPTFALLPQPGISLELNSTPPKTVAMELRMDGTIRLEEPYPNVEVSTDTNLLLIRLTSNELRIKRPCRPPIKSALV